jgi:hypothetical protein
VLGAEDVVAGYVALDSALDGGAVGALGEVDALGVNAGQGAGRDEQGGEQGAVIGLMVSSVLVRNLDFNTTGDDGFRQMDFASPYPSSMGFTALYPSYGATTPSHR